MWARLFRRRYLLMESHFWMKILVLSFSCYITATLSYNLHVTICMSSCSKAVWTDCLLISMCSEGLTLSGAKRRQCQPRPRFLLPDEPATVGAPSLYKEESVYYWWLTTPHPCKKSLIVLKRASNSRHSCWKMMMAIPGLKLLTSQGPHWPTSPLCK